MITLSVLSTRYVQVKVEATGANGPINPVGDVVKMAFMPVPASGPGANPGAPDWHLASWFVPAAGVYFAQCLVGPANGGVALAAATYAIWVQVVDSPEVPTDPVGLLQIT